MAIVIVFIAGVVGGTILSWSFVRSAHDRMSYQGCCSDSSSPFPLCLSACMRARHPASGRLPVPSGSWEYFSFGAQFSAGSATAD
jgi:hypothetical protein